MKRSIFLLVCAVLFVCGCANKTENAGFVETASVPEVQKEEAVQVQDVQQEEVLLVQVDQQEDNPPIQDDVPKYDHENDPMYWTISRQQMTYDELFSKGDLKEVIRFREFVESLAQYHHNDPVYEYNPLFLCIEKYPEAIPFILEEKKELFLSGNITMGDYSESPFLYAVKNLGLDEVKFFFDNDIPVLDVSTNQLYGSTNRGGPRFGIGGNILLFVKDQEVREYLISKGVEPEVEPPSYFYYYLKQDTVTVYEKPGLDSAVVASIPKKTNFTADSILTFRVDDTQWLKITWSDGTGWIQTSCVDFDSGI